MSFWGRMFLVGGGGVSATFLSMLNRGERKLMDLSKRVTLITPHGVAIDVAKQLGITTIIKKPFVPTDVHLYQVKKGDVVVNLAGLPSLLLAHHCRSRGAMYLDTTLESVNTSCVPTCYAELKEEMTKVNAKNGSTALLNHGCNPGLVTHMVKQALLDVARARFTTRKNTYRSRWEWAQLARQLRVIHVQLCDRDTQTIHSFNNTKATLYNTWSPEGLLEESTQSTTSATPKGLHSFHAYSWLNDQSAWEPRQHTFTGKMMPHPEVLSIADLLTLHHPIKTNKDGTASIIYRPSVEFVYQPCPSARYFIDSKLRENGSLPHHKSIKGQVFGGRDLISENDFESMGVILTTQENGVNNRYWYGSTLTVKEARKNIDHFDLAKSNVTLVQTASGVLAGLSWLLQNPSLGIVLPEDIQDHTIPLNLAKPYLGSLEFIHLLPS